MKTIEKLSEIWRGVEYPFLIGKDKEVYFSEILNITKNETLLEEVKEGDVVALIGDFNPTSILLLLKLIDLGAILMPLTIETKQEHDYFFETGMVDVIIENNHLRRIEHNKNHELIDHLRKKRNAGLILFSTGTTGRPKAILHDLTLFLKRFDTPRPTLKTINFLLFDHIGGINTLLHTLFNKGIVVAPESRAVESIIEYCSKYEVEVLPTTPTFLRMMLMSGNIPEQIPNTLKVITYGTERMDQPTLDELCTLLPNIDFRQTYGMSELGIVRVKSESRNSLFMKIGGEGIETKVADNILFIRSETRMLGYLNAPSPFDTDGWYNTKDIVETKGEYFKITGRTTDVINVGGLKFMASEVERVALCFANVSLSKAIAKQNPITGQHVELIVQPKSEQTIDKDQLMLFLKEKLQPHMVPKRIRIEEVAVGHRFKRA